MSLLSVADLRVEFDGPSGPITAVEDAAFRVESSEIVGLVGESGSGKSVTARSILGLQSPGRITAGRIDYDGRDLTAVSESTRRCYRGTEVALVPQDPTSALDPAFDVGDQIAESLRVREAPDSQSLLGFLGFPPFADRMGRRRRREEAVELLRRVDIPDPEERIDAYPHELSGGMRQRVLLAIALAGEPSLLVVDEPTTGLDTTTQACVLNVLCEVATETDTAILLITHDVGIVEECCDRTVVMGNGRTLEAGPTAAVLADPRHSCTEKLFSHRIRGTMDDSPTVSRGSEAERLDDREQPFVARPERVTADPEREPTWIGPEHWVRYAAFDTVGGRSRADAIRADGTGLSGGLTPPTSNSASGDAAREPTDTEGQPAIEARGVRKVFDLGDSLVDRLRNRRRTLRAVDGVDFSVHAGETLGIVGESGSGKSTLVDILAGLSASTGGEVRFDGVPVGTLDERSGDQLADVGVVFQQPRESVNPHRTVGRSLAEPLVEDGWTPDERTARVEVLLEQVELGVEYASRYPHQLSGGQLQRVAIARALALEPRVVLLDEPTVGLDLSTRAQLLDLLAGLQRRHGIAYVVVSHDLHVVQKLADRTLVMYLGRVMERGPTEILFDRPSHPYTAALINALPPRVGDFTLDGEAPSAIDLPSGCVFRSRCPLATAECKRRDPDPTPVGRAESRCHFAEDVADRNV